ncbi:MAG: PPOX class F420-dependent oxidoreductase [Actinobacteria bacterium]|nr:PPOX class F420-dependent oxidoreductase [Actinomycetota bacterium]
MDVDQARQFLREHHRAVLVTHAPRGVQTSPVTVGVDDDGGAVVSSRETAYKVRNLRRDPRATLCVFPDTFFGHWIQIDGTATILSLPDAMEPLVNYYRSIRGEHPDWDEYRAAMEEERRVIVYVSLDRVGPTHHG